jgi:phosphosulfolactate phosphohydrolase-like enzyme
MLVSANGAKRMSHLDALNLRLSNERNRLATAKTVRERDMRKVWVAQIEKEIAFEVPEGQMTDDELLAALAS